MKITRKAILYQLLASQIEARANCAKHMDTHAEWFKRHTDTINQLVREHMPSGSGWDNGTTIDLDASHADKLVFHGSFHHMNDNGMYDGWTEHTITVVPSLAFTLHIRITGRNRNRVKDDLHETFDYALNAPLMWIDGEERWRDLRSPIIA